MASGNSLAPLGAAYPPPRDMKEVKEMNKTMAKDPTDTSYYQT